MRTRSGFQELLNSARSGSNPALGELLQACDQYLRLVAREKLGPGLAGKAGPSDMVQETFVSASKRFSSFKGASQEELAAWLRKILVNHVTDMQRRYVVSQKRNVNREVSIDHSQKNCPERRARELVDDIGETPSRHLVKQEAVLQLLTAMKQLPPNLQLVIQLRHRENLPFEIVAERLGISASTARQQWARAITKIQKIMEPRDSTRE